MSQNGTIDMNRLIGEFMDLQEQWAREPQGFDWSALESLARKSASAYNEGAGPSFHMVVLDGVKHGEFHERFLASSIAAGFDPFKLAKAGNGHAMIPVLGHSGLADAASMNPISARMRASLMELAQVRFGPLVQEGGADAQDADVIRIVETCAESIPGELLAKFAPELARRHDWGTGQQTEAVEGLLSNAELIAEKNSKSFG